MEPCTFHPKLDKINKIHPEKISFISGNGNSENISYIFLKESFSNISGNGNPPKILIFQETEPSHISGSNFQSLKNKKKPSINKKE